MTAVALAPMFHGGGGPASYELQLGGYAASERMQTQHGFVPPPSPPKPVVYDDVPAVTHAADQKYLKSEDLMFSRVVSTPKLGDAHSILMVCDGHMGPAAADHCVQHLPGLLGQLLPQHLPDWTDDGEVASYSEAVRRAISSAVLLLDNSWVAVADNSGTTLTLAVLSGWLLTVANTGDSNAILDCGDDVREVTYSHRIQVNKTEQARLRQAGAQLAPLGFHLQGPAKPQEMGVGPLRMWPGGLCVSRSIGDVDAGPLIIPLPHVRQLLLNRNRALRLIMASDGLWDLMSFSKAAKSVRHKLPQAAVDSLMAMVVRDKRMADDVTIIIVDVLPPLTPGATPLAFPASALKSGHGGGGGASGNGAARSSSGGSAGGGGGGGLFGLCFKAPAVVYDEPPVSPTSGKPPAGPQQQQAAPPSAAAAAGGGGGPTARRSLDVLASNLARLSGRGGGPKHQGPAAKPWTGLAWMADVDCFQAYPAHKDQMEEARAATGAGKGTAPPTRVADYTVHGGQAHRFQQDSSWHSGATVHGGSGLPTFLSEAQVQALQADPSAAASMVLQRPAGGGGAGSYHGRSGGSASPVANGAGGIAAAIAAASSTGGAGGGAAGFEGGPAAECDSAAEIGRRGRGQQSVPLMMATARSIVLPPGAEPAGGSSSSSGAVRRPPASAGTRSHGDLARQEVGLARSAESCSAAAAPYAPAPPGPAVGAGRSRAAVAGAAAPPASGGAGGSITRSASAVFEHDGSTGVYMAADCARTQGGSLLPNAPPVVTVNQLGHFGSAPGAALAAAAESSEELSPPAYGRRGPFPPSAIEGSGAGI